MLGKSPSGEAELGNLFDKHGQALRHNTKLVDARAYGADFDKQTFINLYPFLPAHFDILLHLLGALAKSTGGIGLRSAIKVIQDVLVEGADHSTPIANQPVGWLATTVTLFDALKKDIEKGYLSLYQSVGKVQISFSRLQAASGYCQDGLRSCKSWATCPSLFRTSLASCMAVSRTHLLQIR